MEHPLRRLLRFVTSPNYSRTFSLLVLLLVIAAIPLTVYVSKQRQELRQRAREPNCRDEGYLAGDVRHNCSTTSRACASEDNGVGVPYVCNVNGSWSLVDPPGEAGECTDSCDLPPEPTSTPEPTAVPNTPVPNTPVPNTPIPNTPVPNTPVPPQPTSRPTGRPDLCSNATQFCTPGSCSLHNAVPGTGTCSIATDNCCRRVQSTPTSAPTQTPARICLQCVNNVFQNATGCGSTNCEHVTVVNGTLCMATSDVRGTACGPGTPTATPVPTTPPGQPTNTPVPTARPGTPTATPIPTSPPGQPTNTPSPTSPPSFELADFNRNGCVGQDDFEVWRQAFQSGVIRQGTFPDVTGPSGTPDSAVTLHDFNFWFNAMLSLSSDKLCR